MIRHATAEDIQALVGIDRENGYRPWSEKTLYNSIYPDAAFVFSDRDEIRGFALFHAVADEVELLNLVVKQGFEGQRIAQTLLDYAYQAFSLKGYEHSFLEVGVNNERAINFYLKYGFKTLATRKDYYIFDECKVDALVMGTHSDEELLEYFKLDKIKNEAMKFMGWKKLFKGEALLDGDHLEESLANFLPELTYEEAFEKTGRAINITISPSRLNHESRMLNAISSPNVYVRKGVLASTAVPGLFPPVTLVAKNYNGESQPYNPSRQWVDGTLSNDLPGKRLSRLYGVNHFIASQVNPHVAPFVSQKGQPKSMMQITSEIASKTTKNVVSNVLKHTTDNMNSPALGYFLTQVHAMVSQDYSADITITPNFNTLNPWKLFNNPEASDVADLVLAGNALLGRNLSGSETVRRYRGR